MTIKLLLHMNLQEFTGWRVRITRDGKDETGLVSDVTAKGGGAGQENRVRFSKRCDRMEGVGQGTILCRKS